MINAVPDKIGLLAVLQLGELMMDHFAGRAHKVFFGTDSKKEGGCKKDDQTEDQKIECNSSGQRGFPEGTV
jgi:hypothetical protein